MTAVLDHKGTMLPGPAVAVWRNKQPSNQNNYNDPSKHRLLKIVESANMKSLLAGTYVETGRLDYVSKALKFTSAVALCLFVY